VYRGKQLTIVGVGSCALTATQPGNANYQSANANATIVINPASQTVTFTPTTPVNFGTGPYTLTATASSGLTAFTFSTTAAATICTVSGNQLTIVGIGSCPLTAAQPGNANYQPASATATVTINAVVAGAPTIGAATPANGQANIAFTPPASDGGSPITSYTVTCNPGAVTASGAASPVTVTGLTNGSAYNCTVIANNAVGPSAPSASVAVTPRTVPDAPTIGAATLGMGQVTIAFTPSASDGGSPITGYTVRCVSALGTVTANGSGSPIVVTGLTNGMLYQCSVVANNLVGASPASAAVTVDLPALPVPLNVGLWLIALLMLAAAVGVQRRRLSER
jgi:large repetitive protein